MSGDPFSTEGPDMVRIELAEFQRLKRLECEYQGFRAAIAMMTGQRMDDLNLATDADVKIKGRPALAGLEGIIDRRTSDWLSK